MVQEPSYSEIEPLVKASKEGNGQVFCLFRCSKTEFEIASSAPIQADLDERASAANFNSGLRWTLLSRVRSILNTNSAPQPAELVAPELSGELEVSEGEVEQAVVQAFLRVQSHFVRGEEGWIARISDDDYKSPFDHQLQQHPIKLDQDRFLLARLLSQVAGADGDFSSSEIEFIRSFAPPGFSAWEEAPGESELQQLEKGVGKTALMLSWALAFSDANLDQHELLLLMRVSGTIGLSAQDLQDCKLWAQEYLVEEGFESAFSGALPDRHAVQQTYLLGQRIGLSMEHLKKLQTRTQKRLGKLS